MLVTLRSGPKSLEKISLYVEAEVPKATSEWRDQSQEEEKEILPPSWMLV
jgi:hypothetical protein